jgi:hypothetical protein
MLYNDTNCKLSTRDIDMGYLWLVLCVDLICYLIDKFQYCVDTQEAKRLLFIIIQIPDSSLNIGLIQSFRPIDNGLVTSSCRADNGIIMLAKLSSQHIKK